MIRLQKIEIEGFRSVEAATVLEYPAGTFALAGQNGAGKTTLLAEALWWALSGEPLRGEDISGIVNRDSKKAKVTVDFIDQAGRKVRLERTRTRKSSGKVRLFRPDDKTDLLAGHGTTKRGARQAIETFLGVPLSVLRATAFYSPARGLLTLTDAGRRALLEEALDLEWVEQAKKLATDRLAEVVQHVQTATVEYDSAKAVEKAEREAAVELFRQAHEARATSEAEIQAQLDQVQKDLETTQAAITALQEQQNSLEAEIRTLTAEKCQAEQTRMSTQTEFNTAMRQVDRLTYTVNTVTQTVQQLVADLQALQPGSICPTCKRPFTAEEIQTAQQQLQLQLLDKVKQLNHAKEAREQAEQTTWPLQQAIQEQQTLLLDLEQKLQGLNGSLLRVTTERTAAETTLHHHLEPRRRELTQALQDQVDSQVVNNLKAAAAEATRKADAAWKQAEQHQEFLAEEEHRKALLEFWVQAFSGKGMRALILEGLLPKLQARAAFYLGAMSDQTLTLTISPVREAKPGKRQLERIEIILQNVHGIASTGAGSCGEQRMADIALALALFDVLFMQQGRGLAFIGLDEALDALDEPHAVKVLQVLNTLAARQNMSIGLVSHNVRIRSGATNTINVVRAADGWTTAWQTKQGKDVQ